MQHIIEKAQTNPWFFAMGVALVVFAAASYYAWRRDQRRQRENDPTRCTAHVVGKVVGGGQYSIGENRVPRCSYEVDGTTYEVEGPKFENVTMSPDRKFKVKSRKRLPVDYEGPSRVTPFDDGKKKHTDDEWYEHGVFAKLYPIGSDVDIYYEPGHPQNAYVQRPIKTVPMKKPTIAIVYAAIGLFIILF